jgi:hypothetical protein
MANDKLSVQQIEINGYHEKMFVDFFALDNDFEDNEECFREDTLELGFENESERCSKELYDKYFSDAPDGYAETLDAALEEAACKSINGCQFIAGNETYTSEYYISLICTDESNNEYIVILSMISK